MYWCVTSDTATSIIADKMGLTAPFKSAKETTNVFSQQAVAMAKDGKKTVAWDFVYIPSEEWKKNLKQALIAYAADNSKWTASRTPSSMAGRPRRPLPSKQLLPKLSD